jgi:hypothetical protein
MARSQRPTVNASAPNFASGECRRREVWRGATGNELAVPAWRAKLRERGVSASRSVAQITKTPGQSLPAPESGTRRVHVDEDRGVI